MTNQALDKMRDLFTEATERHEEETGEKLEIDASISGLHKINDENPKEGSTTNSPNSDSTRTSTETPFSKVIAKHLQSVSPRVLKALVNSNHKKIMSELENQPPPNPKTIGGFTQNELEQMSPRNAAINALSLAAAEKFGRDAITKVRPLLLEHNLDPSTTSFDVQNFYKLLEREMEK